MSQGSHQLKFETLSILGGAERIVRTHLDSSINRLSEVEQGIGIEIFRYLVTPSGSKVAYTPRDLADYTRLKEEEVTALLRKLADSKVRILRYVDSPDNQSFADRYEIFHDVLAPAMLDWRKRAETRLQLS